MSRTILIVGALLFLALPAWASYITVDVDITSDSCPDAADAVGRGVISVAIIGADDFDVNQVDFTTVQLEGVPPLSTGVGDVATAVNGEVAGDCYACFENGPDGRHDLTLEFDFREIVSVIGDTAPGECVPLQLTGSLLDGTPIEGEDLVVLLEKEKGN